MRTIIGAQGEVKVYKIDAIPEGFDTLEVERDQHGNSIVSHSEKGHHHVLDRDIEVIERKDAPTGMRILYGIVKSPTSLRQTASVAHDEIALTDAGIYEFRISREYNPFADEARRVAD